MEEYNVEFLLSGENIILDKLTKSLGEVGRQLEVARQGETAYKINIIAQDPKKVFDRTSRFGKPTSIKVDEYPGAQDNG